MRDGVYDIDGVRRCSATSLRVVSNVLISYKFDIDLIVW